MALVNKPRYVSYEDADPPAKAVMDPLLEAVEQNQWSKEFMASFGEEARQDFHRSIAAIQAFLEDPMSPEADQQIKDRLREQYLAAAQTMAFTLSAGEEALRRYDAHYVENAAEELVVLQDEGAQKNLNNVIACRDTLAERMKQLAEPEKTHDFVCAAIARLEGGRQFSISLARGLPLEEPISVRKSPLKLARPGMGA